MYKFASSRVALSWLACQKRVDVQACSEQYKISRIKSNQQYMTRIWGQLINITVIVQRKSKYKETYYIYRHSHVWHHLSMTGMTSSSSRTDWLSWLLRGGTQFQDWSFEDKLLWYILYEYILYFSPVLLFPHIPYNVGSLWFLEVNKVSVWLFRISKGKFWNFDNERVMTSHLNSGMAFIVI